MAMMKKFIVLLLVMLLVILNFNHYPSWNNSLENDSIADLPNLENETFFSTTFCFTENLGQIPDNQIKFTFSNSYQSVGFLNNGYKIYLSNQDTSDDEVTVIFENANEVKPIGNGLLNHTNNYFTTSNIENHITNVPNYSEIIYHNIYDGIDLLFYTEKSDLKYDFIVHPYANPDDISFRFEGIDSLMKESNGDITIQAGETTIKDKRPIVFQMIDNEKVMIGSEYVIDNNRVCFQINDYDTSTILIIDPLLYATYIGGSNNDEGVDIAFDNEKNVFVLGNSRSSNFPGTGVGNNTRKGGEDIIIMKWNHELTDLLFCTYIGGSKYDEVYDMEIDMNNNIYIVGSTISDDFPVTQGCYDDSCNGEDVFEEDIFISVLSPNGAGLLGSTFIGGGGREEAQALSLDKDNNIYITGLTDSTDFPTTEGCYQKYLYDKWNTDMFVCKMNMNCSKLLYSSFIGGDRWDEGNDIVVDYADNVYIVGTAGSTDFPTTNCLSKSCNNTVGKIIIIKMNLSNLTMNFSTCISGNGNDGGKCILLDDEKNIYILGGGGRENFPKSNKSYDYTNNHSSGMVVCKLSADGQHLLMTAFIGGRSADYENSFILDLDSNLIIIGSTDSEDFPTIPGCFDTSFNGKRDIFIVKLSKSGNEILYSSFIGGKGWDFGRNVILDPNGNIIFIGHAQEGFPCTENCSNELNNGSNDIVIGKLDFIKEDVEPSEDDEINIIAIIMGIIVIIVFVIIIGGFAKLSHSSKKESIPHQNQR